MRLGPIHPRSRLPARGRRAAGRLRLEATRPAPRARAAENRPAPPKSDFPSRRRALARRGARSGRAPPNSSSPRRRSVFYKGENRFPFGVFEKDRTQVADAEVALYFAKVPKVNPKAEKEGAKGAEARAQIKALEEPATGPFPASIESLATQPAFRAADDQRRPRRGDGRLLDRHRLPQRRRVADRGRDQGRRRAERDAAAQRRRRRGPSASRGSGQKAPLIHTPTAGRRRRRPLEDHDADPARHPEQGRLRRRARERTDRPLVCDPPVLPESGLRPGRRRGRAGQTALRRQGGLHPHGDLRRQRPAPSRSGRRCGPSTCRREPWLFAIDSDGTIGEVLEGAFGVDAADQGGRRGHGRMSAEKKAADKKARRAAPDPALLDSFAAEARRRCDVIAAGLATETDRLRDDARRSPRAEGHRRRRRPAPPGRAGRPDGIRPRRSEEDRRHPRRPHPPDRRRRQGPRRGRHRRRPRAKRSPPTSAAPWPSCSAPSALRR